MVNRGIFRPPLETHKVCLLFSFLPIFQAELNKFMKTWNMRTVCQSASAPGGRPDLLFQVPSMMGYQKQGIEVQEQDLDIATKHVRL